MARIGILTGGGDCPGLNAVIRAVVRRAGGHMAVIGFRYGWAGVMDGDTFDLTLDNTRGLLHRGGHDPRHVAHQSLPQDDGPERIAATLRDQRLDALIAIGGEDTLGVARRLGRARHRRGRRAEDDRQRPGGHGLHLRFPHRGADRHRRDRPPAHHRRVAQPGDGGGGDGPPRWLDRHLQRHGRRRRCDPRARAALRRGRGLRQDRATPRGGRTFSIVVVAEGATAKGSGQVRAGEGRTRSATPGSAASRWTWSGRSRSARGSSRA